MSLNRLTSLFRDRRTPSTTIRDRRRNRARLGLESLESRQVLSTVAPMPSLVDGIPDGPFTTAPFSDQQHVSVPYSHGLDISSSYGSNYLVYPKMLTPMQDTRIDGILPGSTPGRISVYLQQGQTLEATLDLKYDYGFSSGGNSEVLETDNHGGTLTEYDFSGTTVLNSSSGKTWNNPSDGYVTNDPTIVFKAPVQNWYTFTVNTNLAEPSNGLGYTSDGISYSLYLRPIGLDSTPDSQLDPNHNAVDAANLAFSGGGLYSWFSSVADPTNPVVASSTPTTGSLTFSGPTGKGFQLNGNWTEQQTSGGLTTYTATGAVTLESALGGVTLPLVNGSSLVVTTQGVAGNSLFGLVQSTDIQINGLPISSFTKAMSNFNFNANLGSIGGNTSLPNASWGIDLGSVVGGLTGAPTNPAVPYLYFAGDAPLSVSYGTMTASAPHSGAGLNVAIDPMDPMVYLDIKGLPGLTDLGFAGSLNDLIPYSPEYTPNLWTGQFYGDVYFRGELDLADMTDESVPAVIDGDVTLNLDPQHLGIGNSAKRVAQDFANMVENPSVKDDAIKFGADIASVSVGIDGTGSLSVSKDNFNLTMPVGGGSLIWNGPTETAYFHGWMNSFNNDLPSILQTKSTSTVDVMINMQTRNFEYSIGSDFTVLGMDEQGSITINNSGVTFEAGLGFDTGWIGCSGLNTGFDVSAYIDLSLTFQTDGDVTFSFVADASLSLEIFGTSYSWSGGIDYSTTFNLETIGTSLWDDIESGFKSEIENNLIDYV